MDKQIIAEWYKKWIKDCEYYNTVDMLSDFAAEFVPQWVSVEERLPDEHRRYLCIMFYENCFIEEVCLFEYSTKLWMFEKKYVTITHWQPLPPPPTK